MKRSLLTFGQRGEINVLLVPLVVAALFLIAAIAFGAWSFTGREDYKNNVDEKIAVAVKAARDDQSLIKDKEHAEADKQPLKTYKGPDQYGSVQVSYPKTWSGYVLDSDTNSGTPLEGYFHPNVVPSVSSVDSTFSLRVRVTSTSYASVITTMNSYVSSKKVTATPYAFPKVPKTVGVRFDGSIAGGKNLTGSLIVVPLRDKTLQISTESPLYMADFNNLILPNVTFSP